jgi:hypothetical protein
VAQGFPEHSSGSRLSRAQQWLKAFQSTAVAQSFPEQLIFLSVWISKCFFSRLFTVVYFFLK